VVLLDDVLATGGTMAAAMDLITHTGATVAGAVVALELGALHGRERLGDATVVALAEF
jgi:adenine phosphoribosyltransferase